MQLTSHQAQTVVDGAEARARALGLPVVIAVLDAGAHLKALRRMDGTALAALELAPRKARTAVLFQSPSEAAGDYCRTDGAAASLAPVGGGLPLMGPNGVLVGGVGVAGGTAAQDVEIADAARAAFAALTP